jgi:pyroglutamyl-peptidase
MIGEARLRSTIIVGCFLLLGCNSGSKEALSGRSLEDTERGGLFDQILDGKFDSAGHPHGATVWRAGPEGCSPETGEVEAEGWGAAPEHHPAGALCKASKDWLGAGRYTVNVRILTPEIKDHSCPATVSAGDGGVEPGTPCPSPPEAVSLRVLNGAGAELARRSMAHDRFREAMTYQNFWLTFHQPKNGVVRLEVLWAGEEAVRIEYVELFRAMRRVVIEPRSQVLGEVQDLRIELSNGVPPMELELSCDGASLDEALSTLIVGGQADSATTEFRRIYNTPASPLLDACEAPFQLKAKLVDGAWGAKTGRVTYLEEPIPCAFEKGKVRVLLTGFETFPADTSNDNSAEQAVKHFDASGIAGVSVMRAILPVEWDTAASMATELIERCAPEVVIGFGQGRGLVQPETTAYNSKDASEIAGGVPDNRGTVMDGQPIVPGGAQQLTTGLPAQQIVDALQQAGESAGTSDNPGRYICNNLFYSLMHAAGERGITAGFIHLPVIRHVDDHERARLQTIVEAVVETTLAEKFPERN